MPDFGPVPVSFIHGPGFRPNVQVDIISSRNKSSISAFLSCRPAGKPLWSMNAFIWTHSKIHGVAKTAMPASSALSINSAIVVLLAAEMSIIAGRQ
jgi:hypothetical protein